MDPDDFALIQGALEPVQLEARTMIDRPGEPINFVYFLEEGMLSVISRFETSRDVEVGVVGREGMSGTPLLLNDGRSTYATNVQVAGYAQRLPTDVLTKALRTSRRLHDFLLRFVRAAEIQTASTASANGRAKLEERLARWLLMAHDRLTSNAVPLTHEFLAVMLGVRRAGVTVAIHAFEQRGFITTRRGELTMVNRSERVMRRDLWSENMYVPHDVGYRARIEASAEKTPTIAAPPVRKSRASGARRAG